VEVVQEVGIGRSSVGTLVLHQVVLQHLLVGIALFHHQQLRQKNRHKSGRGGGGRREGGRGGEREGGGVVGIRGRGREGGEVGEGREASAK